MLAYFCISTLAVMVIAIMSVFKIKIPVPILKQMMIKIMLTAKKNHQEMIKRQKTDVRCVP